MHAHTHASGAAWTLGAGVLDGCSPLADFGVLALGAEGSHLKLNGTLLHREEESACSRGRLPETSSSGFYLADVVRRRLQSH